MTLSLTSITVAHVLLRHLYLDLLGLDSCEYDIRGIGYGYELFCCHCYHEQCGKT